MKQNASHFLEFPFGHGHRESGFNQRVAGSGTQYDRNQLPIEQINDGRDKDFLEFHFDLR